MTARAGHGWSGFWERKGKRKDAASSVVHLFVLVEQDISVTDDARASLPGGRK